MSAVRVVRLGSSPVRVVQVVGGAPGATMKWQGDWSGATAYAPLDAVSDAGSSYLCIAAVGPSATHPASDTAHWALLAVKGTDGTGTVNGPASAVDGHMAVFDGTTGAKVKDGGAPLVIGTTSSTAMAGNKVATDLGGVGTARKVSAGTGLTGGGDLTADRTLAADFGTASGKVAQGNDSRFVGVGITDKSSAYTLVAADAGSVIRSTASGAITITVPASTFSSGQIVEILQYGAGQVTVAAGSGVTLRLAAAGLKTKAQYSSLSILFLSATEAVVSGDGSA
ncbi:MAG: hypothetical protein BGO26_06780 [Actinobacteria bacterium 69-20]|nr:hypothetical protein [Actinomycetota bacterium]OJV28139.1 MAG: hypothetical protein BGO26_06780 [Actinobacteria bacterium 69-20]